MAGIRNTDTTPTIVGTIMDDLLFDVGVSLSPKLQWLDRNQVTITYETKDKMWYARCRRKPEIVAEHADYDECLYELARMHGWRMWNEEEYDESD